MWFAVGGGGIVCVNLSSSKVTQYLADSEKDTLTVGKIQNRAYFLKIIKEIFILVQLARGYSSIRRNRILSSLTELPMEYFRVIIVIISASLPGIIVCLFAWERAFYL